jgi:hypothetical protein
MLPATDATPAYYALSSLLRVPVAEFRAATDLAKDPWGDLIEVLSAAKARPAAPPSTARADSSDKAPPAGVAEPRLSGMNPWLIGTMEIIDAHRKALHQGAADKPRLALLNTAEMLASYISDIGPRRRPQLNIEPEGRPTFATAVDDFYIHLTVDTPDKLTWYATVGGDEHFDEGVAFDGRKMPPGLQQLFSL